MAAEGVAFVNGDWVYLVSNEVNGHLQAEGFQLVLATSVLGGPDAWHSWLLSHQSVGAATLHSGDVVLLYTQAEAFICVEEDGRTVGASCSPTDALTLSVVRVDGGGPSLEVGALVELRLGASESGTCLQLLPDGSTGIAALGATGSRFQMQSDGAVEGSPHWANPRCIGFGRMPAHVPLRSYRSQAAARAREDPRLRLSGCDWDFCLFPSPDAVPRGIERDWSGCGDGDSDCATGTCRSAKPEHEPEPGAHPRAEPTAGTAGTVRWRKMPVPSNWQLHVDDDPPIYTNVAYPWNVSTGRLRRALTELTLTLTPTLSLSLSQPHSAERSPSAPAPPRPSRTR